MFRLSVRGLPSNKHVHLKCLLNQGSKTLEPPQTQQTTVESDCYCCKSSTSPPQNLSWPIVFITFGSFYVIYKCFFFQIPLACFSHLQNVQSFLKNTTQNPGERVPCFPPVSRVDGWDLWTSPIEPGGRLLGMKDLRFGDLRICVNIFPVLFKYA